MLTCYYLAALLMSPPAAEAWPGFRGDGSNISVARNLPVEWSPTKNVAWRTTLAGYGQSSPVVWGDLAFVTAIEGEEKNKYLVSAIHLRTGRIAWWHAANSTSKGKNNPMMSRAAPTPLVDHEAVYAFFETGDVIALSHTGMVKWQRSLTKDYGAFKNNHGLASSPVQTDKAVVILIDDMAGSYLLALDKATGKNLWKTVRPNKVSWTSPTLMYYEKRPIIVVSSSGSLTLYDGESGRELANLEGLVGNNIPSPTVCGSRIIIGAGENRMKPDRLASVRSNCCIELKANGNKLSLQACWQGKKALSHHASPLAHRDHAYFVDKTGIVHCVSLATGEEQYAERFDNPCWTTPLGHGDHVYFFGKDGVTTVLKAGPRYERVATNRLWSADEFKQRLDDAKAKTAATLPKPPEGKGPAGGPPLPKEELEAIRYSAVGDVVYGMATVEGTILLRTGTELIAIRASK